jgi:hypothetical protein
MGSVQISIEARGMYLFYVCIYICVCVCMYVCIHIYTRMSTFSCSVFSCVGRDFAMGWSSVLGVLTKCLNGFTVSEVNSESEQARGFNPWKWQLTPWRRVLIEKLTVTQRVKNFPTFYGIRRFIIAFTGARHWSLSWATRTQSTLFHPISLRFVLIISYHLRQVPNGLLTFKYCNRNFVHISHLSQACYRPRLSHKFRLDHPNNTWSISQITKLLIMQSSSGSCHFFPISSRHSPSQTPSIYVI